MKNRTFLQSLNHAVEGFVHVVRKERNMRVHFLFAFFLLLLAFVLRVNRLEWMILCGAVCFVLAAEMINTAIEEMVDLLHPGHNPKVRVIKDVSAGMVLVSAMNAVMVGFIILVRYSSRPFEALTYQLRHAAWNLTFITLMVVLFLVIAGKAMGKKGTPFRGGAVSGHSAIAFSLWTIILFTQTNTYVICITLFMACLVAQSRLRAKIHSLWEVLAGSLIGILATTTFFGLFR